MEKGAGGAGGLEGDRLAGVLAQLCLDYDDPEIKRLWRARDAAERAGNLRLHRLLGRVLLWTAAQRPDGDGLR